MKKHCIKLTVVLTILMLPGTALAQKSRLLNRLRGIGQGAGYDTAPSDPAHVFEIVIGELVQAFMGLLGIIFVCLIIYGGYNWMTSAGDESKVTKAKETIQKAIVGLIITASAFGIWRFIADVVL